MYKKIFFLLILFMAFPATASTQSFRGLLIKYDSPELSILITNHLCKIGTAEYGYDSPIASTPSEIKKKIRSKKLTTAQLAELILRIDQSGFFNLKESYGAPPEDRHYPYRITVDWKNRRKSVLFRSNPSAENAPKAFSDIEKKLIKLSQ